MCEKESMCVHVCMVYVCLFLRKLKKKIDYVYE